ELADRLGISVGAVRDVEQGRTRAANDRFTAFLRDARLRLRILGPLEATRRGRQVDLGPPAQRAILAMLALEPGRWLHRDQLATALWADRIPAHGIASVHTYVSRLRRVLDPDHPPHGAGPIRHDRGHYRLDLEADQLDLFAWRTAIARARAHPDTVRYEQ